MEPIADPAGIDHPALRELAEHAVRVARLEEAMEALEDLVADLADDPGAEGTDGDGPRPGEDGGEDPLAVAWEVVQARWEEEDRALEERVLAWLAEDPEHWPIFRLVVLDPWQDDPGRWRVGTPRWVRTLGTDTVLAHFHHDPYGRQRVADFGLPEGG